MSVKKKETSNAESFVSNEEKQKTCFVIMPIADHPDYEPSHFNRVYEYLIKPACVKAGYLPIRADDSKASHMIMFDILKKIMDCDMAICDLSSKNANVFYELGLRQAFNKKTILITDGRDKAPFDIAGFRYVTYSPSLRVDTVKIEIESINQMLIETESMPEDDVNSIVKLLKIKPAHVETLQLNENESVIFNMMNKLQNQIEILADNIQPPVNYTASRNRINKSSYLSIAKSPTSLKFIDMLEQFRGHIGDFIFKLDDRLIGKLHETHDDFYLFITKDGRLTSVSNDPETLARVTAA